MQSKTIEFSGLRWKVRNSETPSGPGPNYFSDKNVWVEDDGLHLAITQSNGVWNCAQASLLESYGYGRYIFYVNGWIDRMDKNVVLGLFTWDDYSNDYANREIDIEFTRWGDSEAPNSWFTVQPSTERSHHKFYTQLTGTHSTHSFEWRQDTIFFESYHGHYQIPPDNNYINQCWIYRGDVFPPGVEVVAINLWLMEGLPPTDWQYTEVIITKFEFIK